MIYVIKRDGEKNTFQLEKITEAIRKALKATGKEYNPEILDLLSLRVTSDFQNKLDHGTITVEQIQDSVEHVLELTGYTDVAKAYILYRRQREQIRNLGQTILDYRDVVNNYVNVEDWRVKENSTVTYSVGGLILSNSGAVTTKYWLSEIYDQEIADAHKNADIHIHDLTMLTGYCSGWSLKQLLLEGLGGITGKITSAPAKHLSSLCNQMVNFLGIMQNEWAAAQSFCSFDTYLAPFVKSDQLPYDKVKKCIEAFIYGVNTPSRWGTQAPFSNITLDWTVPGDLADKPAIVGGRDAGFSYGDCQKEMDMVNRAFLETMLEGDAQGLGFQYPIPSYCITSDFIWDDSPNNRLLFEMAAKYGTPYFCNYLNGPLTPGDTRTSYIAPNQDFSKLRQKTGGFFGYGENTGSIGVVTINLPRIAYLSTDAADFYKRLDQVTDIAARSLKIKRDVISNLLTSGLYPYTQHYMSSYQNHFSTIGIIGMNEAGLNAKWLRKSLSDPMVQDFTQAVLKHMRDRLVEYQKEYKALFSLEASPAESACYRLAFHDKKQFPDLVTAGNYGDVPYYTNSTHLAVNASDDLWNSLDIQNRFQPLYTSGTVFHVYLEKRVENYSVCSKIVHDIVTGYQLPYFTLTPAYSLCPVHGYLPGAVESCPVCGQKSSIYSRIVGYYRPILDWNKGKQQEFKNRIPYRITDL